MKEKEEHFDTSLNFSKVAFLAATFFVLEMGLLNLLFFQKASFLLFFIAHFSMSLASIFWGYRSLEYSSEYGWILFLGLLQGAFGPIGSGGIFLIFFLRKQFLTDDPHLKSFMDFLFREPQHSFAHHTWEKVRANAADEQEQKVDMICLRDRMRFGDEDQKRAVLTLIGNTFSPFYARLLKYSLRDPNSSVRIHAATILTKISRKFQDQVTQAIRDYEASPEDTELLLKVAESYDSYAYSETVESVREQRLFDRAQEFYEKYLQKVPHDKKTLVKYGRLLLRKGNKKESYRIFKKVFLDTNQLPLESLSWFMELCYDLEYFQEIRDLMESLENAEEAKTFLPLPMQESFALWQQSQDLSKEVSHAHN